MATFVISASLYIDGVKTPDEANAVVKRMNEDNQVWSPITGHHHTFEIILPDRHDPGSSRWEA